MGRQKVLNLMVASIPRIYSVFNFFVNASLICCCHSQNVFVYSC